ncbi:hypothetical protein DH2020_048461 [Rehmannia glutinosa]|uniref:HECT-type E3 ubiquitin transferase n=1 Tax=Rehmannia glutinosa TaxID=99300 RepID=A0ABR0U5L5_REHGL
MFFTGDPSTRKRVDLGGRSTKEIDRQKLLEQTRLERNRRLCVRQQNSAALKIQESVERSVILAPEKSNQSANVLLEAIILLIDLRLPWACNTVLFVAKEYVLHVQRNNPDGGDEIRGVCMEGNLFLLLCCRLDSTCVELQLKNCAVVDALWLIEDDSYDPVLAVDFATVATFLLQALPPLQKSNQGDSTMGEDEMLIGDELMKTVLNRDLEQQIFNALDPRFLLQLVCNLLVLLLHLVHDKCAAGGISPTSGSSKGKPDDNEVAAVGAACSFLHVTFNILPLERIMTVLAYRTELVPILWNFIKRCHENDMHMLMIVDNEEFYEQEKPLSLMDIRLLIVILRQVNPTTRDSLDISHFIEASINVLAWLLKVAPVLWSFCDQRDKDSNKSHGIAWYYVFDNVKLQMHFEVKKRTEQLLKCSIALWQILWLNPMATPNFSTSADGLSAMKKRQPIEFLQHWVCVVASELMSQIRITFVNEFGVEEAGIDGGGIFKDFMENITRAAFDIQYGLFKETADHLLYPNPGSGMIHEQHLQFFHFLGTILAKVLYEAMFEGILVDIPFATFFLSKLKQKYNYLNDLPSLDPELYRHLIFRKHYGVTISELELYFVIVNNEYGEQTEEELLPGGKTIRVTNENVITFIHLVANHRLNFQIRQQSSHFLRGFQQLIQKDWIDMFNEHELQDHYVIEMFWEVVQSLSLENQRKFLTQIHITPLNRNFKLVCPAANHVDVHWAMDLKPITLTCSVDIVVFKNNLFFVLLSDLQLDVLVGLGLDLIFDKYSLLSDRTAGNAFEEALDRLPTSATYMNLLKLPPYRSKQQMEQKLLYAINSDAGFDLS